MIYRYLLHGIDDAKYTKPLIFVPVTPVCLQIVAQLKEIYLTTYDHLSSTGTKQELTCSDLCRAAVVTLVPVGQLNHAVVCTEDAVA